jgi:hypothetical protein
MILRGNQHFDGVGTFSDLSAAATKSIAAATALHYGGSANEVVAQLRATTIMRSSFRKLKQGIWLNDEIINFFHLVLSERDAFFCEQTPGRKRNHFFNSLFMVCLLNEDHNTPAWRGRYSHAGVKRWSKRAPGGNLFDLDKLFFPIHQGMDHWVCAVVFVSDRLIKMYNSKGKTRKKKSYLKTIFQYLKDEHRQRFGVELPAQDDWRFEKDCSTTPQQTNDVDCGVFTCLISDSLSTNVLPPAFTQAEVTKKGRERIAQLIMLHSSVTASAPPSTPAASIAVTKPARSFSIPATTADYYCFEILWRSILKPLHWDWVLWNRDRYLYVRADGLGVERGTLGSDYFSSSEEVVAYCRHEQYHERYPADTALSVNQVGGSGTVDPNV